MASTTEEIANSDSSFAVVIVLMLAVMVFCGYFLTDFLASM